MWGGFIPSDKTLQFFLDALPFIVLGVGEDVLALYFVFYSINGFFQHCNIQLQLGPLNYLISGPELHRWHHSRVSKEANSNYGNNIIVWDLIFGTYFFPKSRRVEELGLLNRDYPLDFRAQMRTPFSGSIDRTKLPLRSTAESIINGLFNLRMRLLRRRLYQPFIDNSKNTQDTQLTTLRRTLTNNAGTEFGRQHHFRFDQKSRGLHKKRTRTRVRRSPAIHRKTRCNTSPYPDNEARSYVQPNERHHGSSQIHPRFTRNSRFVERFAKSIYVSSVPILPRGIRGTNPRDGKPRYRGSFGIGHAGRKRFRARIQIHASVSAKKVRRTQYGFLDPRLRD